MYTFEIKFFLLELEIIIFKILIKFFLFKHEQIEKFD